MTSNIGCFIAGCNNPVIGQCSGYKTNCLQFYCHIHSISKLCLKCGIKEATDRVYHDYLETAKKIKEPGFFDILLNTNYYRNLEKTLSDIEKTKPGFLEFYENYKIKKEEEEAKRLKELNEELLGAIVGGVISGVGSGISDTIKLQGNFNAAMRDVAIREAIEQIRYRIQR